MSHWRIDKAQPGGKYRLAMETFRKRRIRDYDNLIGGAKLLIDALKNEQFIWDDNEKLIGMVQIGQDTTKGEVYTLIQRENK